MALGDVTVSAPHATGATTLIVKGLTGYLQSASIVPNQIVVYQASTYGTSQQVSGTYSVTAAGGNYISGLSLTAGTDGPWVVGDFVLPQVNAPAGAGSGTVTSVAAGAGLSGGTITTTGTIAVANTGITTAMLAAAGVTYAKVQNVAATALLGNPTGSPAAPSEITLGSGLAFSGTTITATGSGSGTVTSISIGTGLASSQSPLTTTGTLSLATIPTLNVMANTSGVTAAPSGVTLSAAIDAAIASTQGDVLYRGAATWAALAPGSSGQVLTSGGAAANPSWTTVTGTGSVTSIVIGSGLASTQSPLTTTGTMSLATIADKSVLGNTTGGTTAPAGVTLSAMIDEAVSGTGTTQGAVLYRGAATWTALAPGSSGQLLSSGGSSANPSWITASGSGTVTSVSVVSANGFTGTVATASTTPAITVATSITGILVGNGTALTAATQMSQGTSGQLNQAAIAAPGSPVAGDQWLDSGRNAFSSYANGVIGIRSRLIYCQVTPVSIVNTSGNSSLINTTSAVGTVALPAGFFNVAGKILRVTWAGGWQSSGTPGNFYWFFKLGTNTIATSGSAGMSASITYATGGTGFACADIVCASTGASGTLNTGGILQFGNNKFIANGTTGGTTAPQTPVVLDLTAAYTFDLQVNFTSNVDTVNVTIVTLEELA